MHRVAASSAARRAAQAVTRAAWAGLKTGCSGLGSGLAFVDGLLTEGLYVTAGTIAAWARTSWRLVINAYAAIDRALGGVRASPNPTAAATSTSNPDLGPDSQPRAQVCAALGRVLRGCGRCLERSVLQPLGACCATLGRAVGAIGSVVGRAVGAGRP
jgi:hypothetical protein